MKLNLRRALFSVTTFILSSGTFAQNLVPDQVEFNALKDLYDNLGGAGWTNKTNWPTSGNWPASATSAEFGTWFGVTVANGDITFISLGENNLIGTIPASMGSLTRLTRLYLNQNQITGPIPSSIGNLTELVRLHLSHNQLTGSIPSSIGNLTKLTLFYVEQNQLSGALPDELGNLTKLEQLYLRYNNLSGSLPESMGNLGKLRILFLHNNKFTGTLPRSLGNLAALTHFYVGVNSFSGTLPSSLGNLTNLTSFSINVNQFTGTLPDALGNLVNLTHFNASNNQLTGSLPPSFSNLTKLTLFYIANNQFYGEFPSLVGNWTALVNLDIQSNNFTGAFPAAIGNCQSLNYIAAGNNQFESLPSSILDLSQIISISFPENALTTIPPFQNHVNVSNLTLSIFSNQLDFTVIEPLIGIGLVHISYYNQVAKDITAITLLENQPLVIPARPPGAYSSQITWEKKEGNNWVNVNTSNDDGTRLTFRRNAATLSDEGTYRWTMNSSKATGFNLKCDPIVVKSAVRSALDTWAFQYKYDGRKRMTHKKVPGADWVYMVYDNRDRLVLTQDGEQRKVNKWSFTKYDALNRPIMTGIRDTTAFLSQELMQSAVNKHYAKTGSRYYEEYVGAAGGNVHGYTNRSYPVRTGTATEVDPEKYLSVTYYDNYLFRDQWAGDYTYADEDLSRTVNGVAYAQPDAAFPRVVGQVTGTKVKVLDGSTGGWLKSVNYYDDKYRVVQSVADNQKSAKDRVTNLYDFVGKVLLTKTLHGIGGTTPQSYTVARAFDYDHAGRLLKVWHQLGEENPILLVHNEYNELGQLVTKKLHNEDPASTPDGQRAYKQHEDFRYNIRGWLTRINSSDLAQEGGSNVPRDLFGMNLIYNETVPELSNTPAFNGNISAVKWSTNLGLGVNVPVLASSELRERAYAFGYDPMNRLLSASHRTKNSNNAWSVVDDFNENNLSYDLNGNILTLNRNGENASPMDRLGYTYTGNQLQDVHDGPEKNKGFVDGNATAVDYVYDANGNMIVDRNKFITLITYNHLNLPATVTKKNGEHIKYTYDASGRKLSQRVFDAASVLKKKTDYAGEFFYENDTLKFINHEEGRVVMTGTDPEYQYHLKDHLGNVRTTFTARDEVESATATLETDNAEDEYSKFIYYDEAVTVFSDLFDHTNNLPDGIEGADPEGYSTRLTGGNTGRIYGLAKSLSVMPGDQVRISVHAKYVQRESGGNWPVEIAGVMNGITTNAPGVVLDGGVTGSIGGGVFPFIGLIDKSSEGGTPPKAYLNYIVFNRDMAPVDWGYQRVTANALETGTNVAHEHLFIDDLIIRESGYVYIYLSNENETPVEVFFDDFKVEHVKSPVVQMDDYYPFGVTFNSYQRENSFDQKYKFNGIERETSLELGWYTAKYRTLDPTIGRWLQVDPKVEDFYNLTPYNNNENNPVVNADPNGDCPWCIGAIAGAVIGGVAGGVVAYMDGQDLEGILTGAAGGAVSGAIIGSGVGLLAGTAVTTSVAGIVATNAATGFVAGAAESVTEQGISVMTGRQDKINTADAVKSAAVGAGANVIAGPIAKVLVNKVANAVAQSTAQQVAGATSKEAQKVLRKEISKQFPGLSNRQVNKEVNKVTAQKVANAVSAGKATKSAAQTGAEVVVETAGEKASEATKDKLRRQ